jgi:hypothetical protein
MGDRAGLVRGRGRVSARALRDLLPLVRELRELGASVIKIDGEGGVLLSFDAPLGVAHPVDPQATSYGKTAAEEERELLFASADDDGEG